MTDRAAYQSLPAELKDRDQWLLWSRDSEPPKAPLNADGYHASWNDPGEWLGFEEAQKIVADREEIDGLGFVVTDNDPYVGLDLDGCLREPNEPKPKDWLPSLKRFENTWMQYSTSGTGIHVFTKADGLPSWWSDSHFEDRDHEGVEGYTEKFFVMTGDELGIAADSISEVDVVPFLAEAYETITGEPPKLPGAASASNTDVDLRVHDIIPRSSYPEGENTAHPFHPSETGTNFRVDDGGETWRCWRHGVTGNAAHLLGIEQGVIECGEWASGGLDSETWREIFNAGREAGYDIPEPDGQTPSPTETLNTEPDGGASSAHPHWESALEWYEQDEEQAARKEAATALAKITDWMYVLESEQLWVYDADTGYFNEWGEARARAVLEQRLGVHWTTHEANEIIARLKNQNQTHRAMLNARSRQDPYLCVGNGVVNLRTGELYDHDPQYKFTRGLKWDYDPETADPKPVREFLDDITEREADRDTLLDHLAHGLMPGHPYRAFVIMYGPGSNGKTRFGKLLRGFVGEDNAASVELQDLTGDDAFATGGLPGAFVNVGDDISVGELRDTSIIKSLTGDGTIRANAKYEKQYEFENEAAMFFSANEPPRITEQKQAINDRLYPIEMPYRFVDNPDPNSDYQKQKITGVAKQLIENEAAMEGLLLMAVEHAKELIARNGQYSMPEGPQERRQLYEAASDPIKRFALDYLEQGTGDDLILKNDAYNVYTEMVAARDERPASEDQFKRVMSSHATLDLENTRTRNISPGESRDPAWRHVRFTDAAVRYMSERLQDRYFDGEMAAESESNPTPTDITPYHATPLQTAAESLTGYVTVTVEIAKVDGLNDVDRPTKAILRDETGAMDLVLWDRDPDDRIADLEGETVALRELEVTEYEGTRQLSWVTEVSSVEVIQAGVGHTPQAHPEQNATFDDMTGRGGRARAETIVSYVKEHGPIEKSELAVAFVADGKMDSDAFTHAFEKAKQQLGLIEDGTEVRI